MDAVALCESQHRELLDKMATVADAAATGAEPAIALSRLTHALLALLATEEQLLFPSLRSDRTAALLTHALEEHAQLRKLAEDLRRAGPQSPAFGRALETLRTRAAHYFDREQRQLLALATVELEPEARQQLGSLMGERFLTLRGHEIRFLDVQAPPEAEPHAPENMRRRDR